LEKLKSKYTKAREEAKAEREEADRVKEKYTEVSQALEDTLTRRLLLQASEEGAYASTEDEIDQLK
jgi:hypothetical protein